MSSVIIMLLLKEETTVEFISCQLITTGNKGIYCLNDLKLVVITSHND